MDNEEPLNDEGLEYNNSEDKQSFIERIAEDRKDIIRSRVNKELQELELRDVAPEELDKIMTQFGTFASMQLLRIVALKLYGSKGNALINEVIQSFISQGKSALMIKQQIDTIEQQESKLTSLLGDEIIEKERELITARVNKIYSEFEKEIKSALLLDDLPEDDIDDENNNTNQPWG
jgi:hypothetical protein